MEKEKKAKEILKELPKRKILGHKIVRRVGRRAWERPRVAISSKLYKIYAVPDPYLPSEGARKWLIGLGPVALKLGENRRQPAPHLRPKEPKKKAPARPKLPNVPRAKIREEAPKPRPKIPVPSQKESKIDPALQAALEKQRSQGVKTRAPQKSKSTDLAAEFGAGPQKHKLARLPVRPDLVRDSKQASKSAPTAIPPQQRSVPIHRSIPKPQSKSKTGRIRMKRTVSKPTVTKTPLAPTPNQPVQKAPEPPKEIKRTAAPKAPNSMSLDDLFGAGGGDSKPIRLRSNRKKPKK